MTTEPNELDDAAINDVLNALYDGKTFSSDPLTIKGSQEPPPIPKITLDDDGGVTIKYPAAWNMEDVEATEIFFYIDDGGDFRCRFCQEISPAESGRWTCPHCGFKAVLMKSKGD